MPNVNLRRAVMGGLVGTAVMTMLMLAGPLMGMPRMPIGEMLGGFLHIGAAAGWTMHGLIGLTLALIYAAAVAGRVPGAPSLVGAIYGFGIFLVAQIAVTPMMGGGVFSGGDVRMIMGSLLGHLIYGGLVGLVYGTPSPRLSRGEPRSPGDAAESGRPPRHAPTGMSSLSLAGRALPDRPHVAPVPHLLREGRSSLTVQALAMGFALLPVVHPLLRPALGPPSHLLWFTHVFPVAWATYVWGFRSGALSVGFSALSVFAGESVFGAGFWLPADMTTRWALVLSVGLTEALVAAFALWIRSAEHGRADLERLALAALDASLDAVMLLDSGRLVRNANRVAQSLFADRGGSVIGRSLESLLDDSRGAPEMTTAGGGRWEGVARSGAGHPFPAEFRFSPVADASGRVAAWLVTVHDRTEELQHEEKDRRNQALSELGTVVAGVAHELNNPLTTVTTYAELLGDQRDTLPAETAEAIEVMAHEARRAALIVRQLLERVRRSSDKRTGLDLGHVVQAVIRARAPHFAAHLIRVVVQLDSDLPPVLGSSGEIEQILVNLVANAQYAMYQAHGGGELRVSAGRHDGGVEVVVEDDGPGIPPDVLPRIFEPFFSTKGADGNGLGLAIARRIARGHGGDLTATNRPEGGARMVLRLPEAPAAREARATPARSPAAAVHRQLAILVVDDEAGIRGSLTKLLARQGHQVTAAENVEQARFLLASRAFDAILTDAHLGDGSGLDLYRAVTAERPDLARCWVFMTGDVLGSEVAAFLRESQALHLSKPFELTDLLRTLARAAATDLLPVASGVDGIP